MLDLRQAVGEVLQKLSREILLTHHRNHNTINSQTTPAANNCNINITATSGWSIIGLALLEGNLCSIAIYYCHRWLVYYRISVLEGNLCL